MRTPMQLRQLDRHISHVVTACASELEDDIEEGPTSSDSILSFFAIDELLALIHCELLPSAQKYHIRAERYKTAIVSTRTVQG